MNNPVITSDIDSLNAFIESSHTEFETGTVKYKHMVRSLPEDPKCDKIEAENKLQVTIRKLEDFIKTLNDFKTLVTDNDLSILRRQAPPTQEFVPRTPHARRQCDSGIPESTDSCILDIQDNPLITQPSNDESEEAQRQDSTFHSCFR